MEFRRLGDRCCVSRCNKYAAACCMDETMRVWNVLSGKLLHEFQPSKQLTTPITSLQFAPKLFNKTKGGSDSILSFGTVDGRIVLYDWSTGKLNKEWNATQGEAQIVAVSWQSNSIMASLSNDNQLTLWNMNKSKIIRQLSVCGSSSLCLLGGNSAAVSSQSIDVINIGSSTVGAVASGVIQQRFTGHASRTSCLTAAPSKPGKPTQYLLSSSRNDTFVNIWKVCPEASSSKELQSPYSILKAEQQVARVVAGARNVAVISVAGKLRIFECVYKRLQLEKPITAVGSLTIFSDVSKTKRVPIVHAFNITLTDISIIYGVGIALHFESINLSEIKGAAELVRNATENFNQNEKVHTLETKIDENITYATAAHMPQVKAVSRGKRKAGADEVCEASLPMEQLLTAITQNSSGDQSAALVGNRKSHAHLLIQGIHSSDKHILQRVLGSINRETIRKTVASLPASAIVPLLTHMHSILATHWHKNISYSMWMREVINQHSSFISTLAEKEYLLRPFLQYCQAVRSAEHRTLQLKSRLDVLTVRMKMNSAAVVSASKQQNVPLLVVQDESSDEEEKEKAISNRSMTNGFGSHSDMEEGEQINGEDSEEESEDEESEEYDSEEELLERMDQEDNSLSEDMDED